MDISVSNQDWGELCQPISHAWMEEKDCVNMWTPVNGYDWPVPIPKDTNLDLICIEMLNLGAEYAWLDVLCLRQAGGRVEHLCIEEWKLDVPTIGAVYASAFVVWYLSGLGMVGGMTAVDFATKLQKLGIMPPIHGQCCHTGPIAPSAAPL